MEVGAKKIPYVGAGLAVGEGLLSGRDPIDSVARGLFGVTGGALGAAGYGAMGLPTGPGALGTSLIGGGVGYEAGTQFYDNIAKPSFMDYLKDPGPVGGNMPGAGVLSTPDVPYQEKGTGKDNRPQQGAGLDMAAIRQESARAEAARKAQEQKNPEVGPTPDYSLDPIPRVQPPAPGDPPNAPTVTPGTPIPQTPRMLLVPGNKYPLDLLAEFVLR